ncbi:MAG: hypothetical protein KAY32_11820 [Candidatus Eisenbacteria sp.]|nr:hypothetical protein [Candidatus Eisenbacteria bacterium]
MNTARSVRRLAAIPRRLIAPAIALAAGVSIASGGFLDGAVPPAASAVRLAAASPLASAGPAGGATAPAGSAPPLQLVETFPIETPLDHPALPEAHEVWLEMIASAGESLAFAEFYASNEPGSRLEPIIAAIEAAAARGVHVRFLAEEKFYKTYPATLDRLAAHAGIEVRRYNVGALMGGVLHAKYFLVDDREAFLGSQNFDWRALTHIQELGVRLGEPALVAALAKVFETDWGLAAGEQPALQLGGSWPPEASPGKSPGASLPDASASLPAPGASPPGPTASLPGATVVHIGDAPVRAAIVASPREWLPPGLAWDLPVILRMIDGAEATARIQLLSYRTVGRDGTYFDTLESALRRAAARGVRVEMLLADWSMRRGTIEGLQSLQALPGITVKLVTIPLWSGGFVPYARVIHAKYMVVDGRAAWIGTSNWERDYFYASRNVGLVIEGAAFAGQLEGLFRDGWEGPYAHEVDPCASYRPPRIGE